MSEHSERIMSGLETKRENTNAVEPPSLDSSMEVLISDSNNSGKRFHRMVEGNDDSDPQPACHTRVKSSWKPRERHVIGVFYTPCTFCWVVEDD